MNVHKCILFFETVKSSAAHILDGCLEMYFDFASVDNVQLMSHLTFQKGITRGTALVGGVR